MVVLLWTIVSSSFILCKKKNEGISEDLRSITAQSRVSGKWLWVYVIPSLSFFLPWGSSLLTVGVFLSMGV